MNTFSSKPVKLTARDGLIMGVLMVVLLLLIAVGWNLYTGEWETMGTQTYWVGIGRTFAVSFILAFAYEYSGFNAKLSAESMRYATGSTLQKYISRNSALVAETLAGKDEKEYPYAAHVRACVRAPRALKLITRMRGQDPKEVYEAVRTRYGPVLEEDEVELLTKLGNALPAVPRLCELFGRNPQLIKYIAAHGFRAVTAKKNMYGELTLDVDNLASVSGLKIIQ